MRAPFFQLMADLISPADWYIRQAISQCAQFLKPINWYSKPNEPIVAEAYLFYIPDLPLHYFSLLTGQGIPTTMGSYNVGNCINLQVEYIKEMYDEFELLTKNVIWRTTYGSVLYTMLQECAQSYWKDLQVITAMPPNIEQLLDFDGDIWFTCNYSVILCGSSFYFFLSLSEKFLILLKDAICFKPEDLICHENNMFIEDFIACDVNLILNEKPDPTPGTTALENFLDSL